MATNLIITEEYLKESSVINGNADMKVITPTIVLVQQIYIEDLLGTKLYNEILLQIQNGNVSAQNQTLLDNYVLPCMLYYVLCECTPVFKYRYANKGVTIKNSENSQPADLQEILFLMDKWRNNAEKLAEKCTKFLLNNTTTYTLYLANTELDETQPNVNNITSGLSLDDPYDDCYCHRRYYE